MQTLKSFLDQALLIWKASTGAARVGILLLTLLCVGAIIGVGIWSAQPDYVVFDDQLDPDKITKVISELKQNNIDYDWVGTTIYVSKRQLADAKVLVGKLSGGTGSNRYTPEAMDLIAGPDARRSKEKHNLESQIGFTLKQYQAIDDATVNLSLPPREPFLRHSKPTKAAVTLTLNPNYDFDETQAASLASVVANSVPGLMTENVVITDQDGLNYSIEDSLRHHGKQEQYRLKEEMILSMKAQQLLERTLGIGNAIVKVNTTFNFRDARIKDFKIDAANAVKQREEIDSSKSTGMSMLANGAVGTESNIDDSGGTASRSPSNTTTEKITTELIFPSTELEEVIRTPELTSMTVSVLVNSTDLSKGNGGAVPPELKQRFEAIVKNAIGFSDQRGDQISLEFLPFVEAMPLDDVVAAPFPWQQIHMILKNISLGMAGLVALLVGLMAFKKLTPIQGPTSQVATSRESQIGELSELVKQNPEVFSKIIAAWSDASPETSTESESSNRQAA